MSTSGYYGIGIYQPKNSINIGTLWRSAQILGASFIFTIGRRYKKQPSDVLSSTKHVPLFEYESFEDFKANLPNGCRVIAVEMSDKAVDLKSFKHPKQCAYMLGAEDNGIPPSVIEKCHGVLRLAGERSLNVAVAGSIVIYDREFLAA